jgi:glycerol-3-phosphate dehydrogenase
VADFDLLVVGGGINGLGVAVDAAMRGLSVCLVEKSDWGGGTTSASSRLIHGGLRYLQYGEVDLVRESLHERGILTRQRPHLIQPIDLLIPTYERSALPRWMVGVGLATYDLLARDPLFPRPQMLSLAEVKHREPGLDRNGLTGGFVYPDAQLSFPERLCVELMQEIVASDGVARNHTEVVGLTVVSGRVVGATLRDVLTGAEETITTRLTVNAAGPWVDAVNRLLPTPPPPLIAGTWGSHLILPTRDGCPQMPIYATARQDGRPFFLLPWDNRLLVGTTDVAFSGSDPGALTVPPEEIAYLLAETNALFPRADYGTTDVLATTIGVRPLPASESGKSAGAKTRRHFLVDHEKRHGIAGLASIVGGKLTTYRSLGESVTNWAVQKLGRCVLPCATAALTETPSVEALVAQGQATLTDLGLSPAFAPRFVRLYGAAQAEVFAYIRRDPTCSLFEAQVRHALTAEGARTVDDVLRRRLMLMPETDEARQAVAELMRHVRPR